MVTVETFGLTGEFSDKIARGEIEAVDRVILYWREEEYESNVERDTMRLVRSLQRQ